MTERDEDILIGMDDTDAAGTRGTGWRARELAGKLRKAGFRTRGVTRHQLLVDDRIPYTSHNSAACIAVTAEPPAVEGLWRLAEDFLRDSSEKESDPGLCLARAAGLTGEATAFGRLAQREVLSRDRARRLTQGANILLAGLGGTHDGMIGALAAVTLRAGGDDGRFIELDEIRELTGVVTVRVILAAGVDAVRSRSGQELDLEEKVETMEWIRPELVRQRAVLVVERSNTHDGLWKPIGRNEPKRRGNHAPGGRP